MTREELNMMCNHELLTAQEERSLSERSRKGDLEARNKLVEYNLRLVASIAKGFVTKRNSLGDCINIGVLGLMKAAEKYDPSKGTKFGTYATWWIKESLMKADWEQDSPLIRVPNWIAHLYKKKREGKKLTEKEKFYLAKAGFAKGEYADISSIGEETVVREGNSDEPEFSEDYKRLLAEALDKLPRRDAVVLRAKFGLPPHNRPVTVPELAKVEGVTPSAIKAMQVKAMEKLRAVFDYLSDGAVFDLD